MGFKGTIAAINIFLVAPILAYQLKPLSDVFGTSILKRMSWSTGITDAPVASCAQPYFELFSRLADDPVFATDIFGKDAVLIEGGAGLPGLAGSFTLGDVQKAVDGDFLDAGRGIPDGQGGWAMASVSEPRGSTFEEAKMRFLDVESAMQLGTVVFNSAGATIPKCGAISLAAQHAFNLPVGLNLYLTAAGTATSAPPHTDKQDVFVLQTKGAKHWRVFAPPEPSKKAWCDPLARGKGEDKLDLDSELNYKPVIDCVLRPGSCLYIPAGWPHTTDTVNTDVSSAGGGDGSSESSESGSGEDSVHLTLGIDTHVWGLDLGTMRAGALKRAGLPDKVVETKLDPDDYWTRVMGVPTSLGFLKKHFLGSEDHENGGEAGKKAMALQLVEMTRALEPSRKWEPAAAKVMKQKEKTAAAVAGTSGGGGGGAPTTVEDWQQEMTYNVGGDAASACCAVALGALEVSDRLTLHCEAVLRALRGQYLDCANDARGPPTEPGAPAISFFRVKQHMDVLEKTMEDHVRWYGYAGTSAGKRLVWSEGGKKNAAAAEGAPAKKGGFGGGGGGVGLVGAGKAKAGGKGAKKKK